MYKYIYIFTHICHIIATQIHHELQIINNRVIYQVTKCLQSNNNIKTMHKVLEIVIQLQIKDLITSDHQTADTVCHLSTAVLKAMLYLQVHSRSRNLQNKKCQKCILFLSFNLII